MNLSYRHVYILKRYYLGTPGIRGVNVVGRAAEVQRSFGQGQGLREI